jgi:multicomponent Na+:H+ antiporter subunit F
MDLLFKISAFYLLFITGLSVYRLIAGPTVFDRTIGVTLISNNAVIMLIIIGFIFGRVDMFLDIAVAYALLNFIISIALGKYFERRSRGI